MRKRSLKNAKNMFDALKVDPSSVLFSEEILDKKQPNKLKKSKYERDKLFQMYLMTVEHSIELIMLRKEKLIILL